MKPNLLTLSVLLLAGLMLGCDKEDSAQIDPQTKEGSVDAPKLSGGVHSKLKFTESPVVFPKEGGTKTISADGKWDFTILIDIDGERSPFEVRVSEAIHAITWASFGRESARQLIAPEGWKCYEVEGGYPNLVSNKLSHLNLEEQINKQIYKSSFILSDKALDEEYDPQPTLINLFPEPEIIVQTHETGFKDFGNIAGGGNYDADLALITSIEGAWFTVSRDWKRWFTPYEGFAYEIVPRPTTVFESLFDNLFGDNGCGAYMIGAKGSWWIGKPSVAPEELELTLELAPNTTGKPRSLGLVINNDCLLNIYQE